MPLNILHLSDLHIGRADLNTEDLTHSILGGLDDKEKKSPMIEQIVVTGDIFDATIHKSKMKKQSFEDAKKFFEKIINGINNYNKSLLSNNDKQALLTNNDILFVPGNHEIDRKKHNKKSKTQNLFHIFKDFLQIFYGTEKNPTYDKEYLSLYKKFEDKKVIIIGVNSAFYDETGCYGKIGYEPLNFIKNNLSKIFHHDYNIVVLLHHHFYPVEESKPDNSMVINTESFLRYLSSYNIVAILHGHKHRNKISRININQDINEPDKIVTTVLCGSLNKDDVSDKYFNIVSVYKPFDIHTLQLFEYQKESTMYFKQKESYLIPVIKEHFLKDKVDKSSEDYKLYSKVYNARQISFTLIEFLEETVGRCKLCYNFLQENKKAIVHMFFIAHYCANRDYSGLNEIKEQYVTMINQSKFENKKPFLAIIEAKNIYELVEIYHGIIVPYIKKCNEAEKEILIFSLISFYISDFYSTITEKVGEFFAIKMKTETDLHDSNENNINEIKNNIIEISSNIDRCVINVNVECTSALAHRVVTLIIKEFELILASFETDFAHVGFKMFYLLGTISRKNTKENSKLESYTFNAYMPTLLNLLTGKHIYTDKKIFIRELIQNSIDAINLRKKLDISFMEKEIIEITTEEKNGNITSLVINDNGVGMTKYHIERYLTTVGRSFYKSEDFLNLDLTKKYKPISQFGIGFLSCFRVSKSIQVETKHWNSKESYCNFIEFPNIHGCFFIDEKSENDEKAKIGATIKLVMNPAEILSSESMKSYIETVFCNIQYDVKYNNSIVKKNSLIDELNADTKKTKLLFIIPFSDNGIIRDDIVKEESARDNNNYGIYIYKKDNALFEKSEITYMCSGIITKDSDELISLDALKKEYFDIVIHLPSENMNLDVSREKITEFHNIDILELGQKLKEKIKLYTGKDNYANLPYLLLCQNSFLRKCSLNKLSFFCNSNNDLCIGLNKKSTPETAQKLLQYFSGNMDLDFNDITGYKYVVANMFYSVKEHDISNILKQISDNLNNKIKLIDGSTQMSKLKHNIDIPTAKGFARDRVNDMARERGLNKAIVDEKYMNSAMDKAMSSAMDIDMAKNMSPVMDMMRDKNIVACYFLLEFLSDIFTGKDNLGNDEFAKFCASMQLIPLFLSSVMSLDDYQKNTTIDFKKFGKKA